ncbi:MAG: hypothetical protein HUU35_20260, partial [Armatimonadetes bacterium]|nr:hypothetical protein [Armatimonadota bacterium]
MKLLLLLLGLTAVAAEPRLTAGALVLELDAQGRAVWFGCGTNLLPSPRPFCLVTKGGKSLPAERLTVAGSRWTF